MVRNREIWRRLWVGSFAFAIELVLFLKKVVFRGIFVQIIVGDLSTLSWEICPQSVGDLSTKGINTAICL